MTSFVLTNDCSQLFLIPRISCLTELRYDPGKKLFLLPGIHIRRFMESWFEVIAGGTCVRPPPRS